MFRGFFALGRLSSELPPLVPTAQSPSAAPARTALMEAQRTRTAISGQIAAVLSEQQRQFQRLSAGLQLLMSEMGPRLTRTDRISQYDKQRLDDLTQQLAKLEQSTIPGITQKSDDLQLKFERGMRHRAHDKTKPLHDDIRQEQLRLEAFESSIMAQLTSLSEGVRTLTQSLRQTTTTTSQSSAQTKRRLEELKPRLAAVESQAVMFTNAVEASLQSVSSTDLLDDRAQQLRQALSTLETETISQNLQAGAAELLDSVSKFATDLERRVASFSVNIGALADTVRTTRDQHGMTDRQLNGLSTSLMNTSATVTSKGSTLNERLTALENSLEAICADVSKAFEDKAAAAAESGQSDFQYLADAVSDLREASRVCLQKRRDEWREFDDANTKANDLIKDELTALDAGMNGGNAVARIAAAERRVRWCAERLAVWRREEQRFGDSLDTQLAECEQAVLDGLRQLGGDPEPFEPIESEPIAPIRAKPDEPPAKQIEPIVIPPEWRLTYEGEVIDDFPPPKKIERRAPDKDPVQVIPDVIDDALDQQQPAGTLPDVLDDVRVIGDDPVKPPKAIHGRRRDKDPAQVIPDVIDDAVDQPQPAGTLPDLLDDVQMTGADPARPPKDIHGTGRDTQPAQVIPDVIDDAVDQPQPAGTLPDLLDDVQMTGDEHETPLGTGQPTETDAPPLPNLMRSVPVGTIAGEEEDQGDAEEDEKHQPEEEEEEEEDEDNNV